MVDKNYRSFESVMNQTVAREVVHAPVPLNWDDATKFWSCFQSTFVDFKVWGGREDVADIGQETHFCFFLRWFAKVNGKFLFTIKGHSTHNTFENIEVEGEGSEVDIDIGNWHSFNFGSNEGNVFRNVWKRNGKPLRVRYRFFGGKPKFVNCEYKILWLQSLGLTVYWWAKYVWHVLLKRPDKMGK